MQTSYSYWLPLMTNVIFTTVIITVYGFLIYRAIKNYNLKSLELKTKLEDLKSHQEKLLLKTELEIQEQTFQFISKEIHDNVTQGLSLAKLNLNIIDIDNIQESKLLIHKSTALISKALSDLNHLSKSLDADLIESYGLIHAIKYEIERWQRLAKNDIELEVNGELQFLNTNSELLIFRIIQESINNIIKYAKAENIKITIIYSTEHIQISVKDDGIGFDPATIFTNKKIGEMAGLKNMRQRAESLDGKLTIDSTPGMGTLLNVNIPINSKIIANAQSGTGRRSQAVA
jgi:two-component system, NarL family, sensor kinase